MINATYALNAYKHARVNTSRTPLDLIIMLYDGAIEYLGKAVLCIDEGNTARKAEFISKTIAIIEELLLSLDMEAGGEISANLQSIYLYMLKELIVANAKNDVQRLQRIVNILKDVRIAWREIR